MNTALTVGFKFKELSETAKANALQTFSDINVSHNWWKWTYEDAESIGLSIDGFDIDYRTIDSRLTEGVYNICKSIMENHGQECDTYKLALEYMPQFAAARLRGWQPDKTLNCLEEYLFGHLGEDEQYEKFEEWEAEFHKKLAACYLKHLRDEYEYQTSVDAIIESIEANDYEFDEDGNQW